MNLNEIIRQRRQAMGLTQEGLAERLGVSAPAVNKWERGLNYPDITLLPTLARTLGVDLNTLLSFQENLTQEEIGQFLNALYETSRQEGAPAAFAMARAKLREFPNSDNLAYSVAGLLEGILVLQPEEPGEEREKLEGEIAALYERCVGSADPRVAEWAAYTLASRCIGRGELERGEELLERLSDTHRDKRELLAALRRKQGRTEEAWTLLERELFDRAHGIQTTLLHLIDLAMKEGEQERAGQYSDVAERVGKVMGLSDYAVLSAPLQLAIAREDGPGTLALLERLFHSLTVPWDLSQSPLYAHLPTKEAAGECQSVLLQPMLEQVERDPDCAFLRAEPGWEELRRRYSKN